MQMEMEAALKASERYVCSISSDLNIIHQVVEEIMTHLQGTYTAMDNNSTFEIKVILNELIMNAIRHGNKCDCTKRVNIIASMDKNCNLELSVTDEGAGFDYEEQLGRNCFDCDPDTLCDIKETGRGIFIVKNLCTSIKYNKAGNSVTVVKKLDNT